MKGTVIVTIVAAAAQPAASPRAVSVAVPPPPPVTIIMEPPSAPRLVERTSEQPLSTFDVVIMVGRETLWSDSVRVGAAGANYSQSLRQAQEPCPGRPHAIDEGYRYVENARQLNFTLSRRGAREADGFGVNVRWQRPVTACEGGGNRGVTLDQQVTIAPGETVRLTGDAGLEVALKRRSR